MDRSGVPQGGPSKHEPASFEINNSALVEPDAQESSGTDQTSSPADSTKDQCNSSSSLVPAGGAHSQSHVQSLSQLALPILAVAAAVLWWLLKPSTRDSRGSSSGSSNKGRGRQQQRQETASPDQTVPAEEEQEEPESSLAVYASDFKLHTQDVQLVARPAALEGLSCVAAEHIHIQGASIGCGIPQLWSSCPTANSHASIIQKLLHKGISIAGQGTTQPFNYPTLGNNMRNPAARFRVAGGGATGASAAVTSQQAHVMVGSDWLGSVRIPAACQGLAALVCTPGVHAPSAPVSAAAAAAAAGVDDQQPSSAGRSSSGGSNSARSRRSNGCSLECAALAAGDVSTLRRVADHLALPGASDLRGELTQVVVAEDLFSLCEQELEAGLLCMKRAVLQWAGQEQAGSVQLLPFLESNCRTWSNLDAAAGGSVLGSVTTGSGKPLPPILRAITHAAQLLYHHQLVQQYSEQAAAVPEGVLDPALSAAIAAGQCVQQQELDDAWQLLTEVQELLHTAVKHDVVVVVPCIPCAPPRIDAPPEVLQSWMSRCHAFAALTALGGVPSVVVPVGQLPNGGGPLAVALFGHSRGDTRLVVVAQKLAYAAQAEFVKLVDKRAQDEANAAASNNAGHADSNGTTGSSSGSSSKAKSRQQQQSEQVDPRRLAKAEKAKARGNDAFKQGKYREAIKSYSDAFKFDPSNPVYLSNRALCYLRLFSFEAAEADCNAVLGFPELGVGDQVKALLRRGTARIHKNELDAAQADFKQVLRLEPNNRQAREELKALADQRRELAEEQRRSMASRISSSGAPHSSSGALAFPPNIYAGADASQGLGGMDAQFGDGFAAGVGGAGVASPEEFEAMRSLLQSGSLPVVLGDEGQPVLGPRGEPVIVGPGGQQMAVGPAGGVTPYRTRRKKASTG